jgi:hypothetical protein
MGNAGDSRAMTRGLQSFPPRGSADSANGFCMKSFRESINYKQHTKYTFVFDVDSKVDAVRRAWRG